MKKKALYILGSLVLLLGGLFFGGQAWVKGRFEKDAVVQQIESQWNCRAELDASTASLFSSPAKVELKGLKLAPRDAETAKPPGQRVPLDPKRVAVSMDRAELSVELADLLHGKVNVKKLRFDGLGVEGDVNDEGRSSLQSLFESPDKTPRVVKVGKDKDQSVAITAGDVHATGVKITETDPKKPDGPPAPPDAPQTAQNQPDTKQPKPKGKREPKEEKKPEPFKAGDMPVSLQVDEAGIYNGRVEITDHGHGTHTLMEGLRFELKDMDVNPADLATHNLCKVEFGGAIKLTKDDAAASIANFEVSGGGKIRPFDAGSGEWNPDLNLDVKLRKGSQLGGATIKDSLRKKDAEKLNEYGIDLSDIALGGVLGEEATSQVHTFNGKVILKQDTRLVFPQYEITIMDGSWFDSRRDAHIVRAELLVGPELSARILEQAKNKIGEKYGEGAASLSETLLKALLLNDKGCVLIPFKSKGRLSKPEPNFDNFLGEISDGFKDFKSKLLNDLIGK